VQDENAMIILDTDIVSIIQRRDSALAESLLARIDRERALEPVFTSIITYEEQMRGWFKLLAAARTMQAQIEAYRRLSRHVEDYRRLKIADFDELAAVEFQRLKGLRIRIGTMDLKIASIALSRQATLWTRNLQDFQQVPGLRFLDPTT
jgi:tRNA(fMet)-specific endonuclease VapC